MRGEKPSFLQDQEVEPRTEQQKRKAALKKVGKVAGNVVLAAGVAAGGGALVRESGRAIEKEQKIEEVKQENWQAERTADQKRFEEDMRDQGFALEGTPLFEEQKEEEKQ